MKKGVVLRTGAAGLHVQLPPYCCSAQAMCYCWKAKDHERGRVPIEEAVALYRERGYKGGLQYALDKPGMGLMGDQTG